MPTVTSIVKQTEMLGQLTRNYFNSDIDSANDSVLVGKPLQNNANFLKSDFGGQPALTNMIENYTTEKDNFQSDLKDAMNDLQKSADELKNSVQTENVETEDNEEISAENVSVANESAQNNISLVHRESPQVRPSHRDYMKEFANNYLVSDKNKSEETQKNDENQDNRLTAVQNFVRDYNNAASYLDENALSKNSELTKSLNEIGISLNSSGELSVDTETLSNALQNNSEIVSSVLGNNLTEQLDKEVNRVNQQSENRFPSITDYANKKESDRAETLYTTRNLNTANHTGIKSNQFLMFNA